MSFKDDIRKIYMTRQLDFATSGDNLDVEKVAAVLCGKVVPYFHSVFKYTKEDVEAHRKSPITLDSLSRWIAGVFSDDSAMKIDCYKVVINDDTDEFMVTSFVVYKTARVPFVVIGRISLPDFGLNKS